MSAVLLLATMAISQTPFDAARADALSSGTPLVIGVGCVPPPSGPTTMTWNVALVRELAGYKAPSVVVQQPTGDKIHFVAMFPASVSQRQIHEALVWFEPPPELPDFPGARTQALKAGKDLVVGLQRDPPDGPWIRGRSEKPFLNDVWQWGGTVAVLKNRGTWFEWLANVEPDAERIKAILLPPDPRDEASFKQERAAPSFPKKWIDRSGYQPSYQDRMDNQRRIRRQTSNLRLIAPRYQVSSTPAFRAGSC
jgi:hypothetical protein